MALFSFHFPHNPTCVISFPASCQSIIIKVSSTSWSSIKMTSNRIWLDFPIGKSDMYLQNVYMASGRRLYERNRRRSSIGRQGIRCGWSMFQIGLSQREDLTAVWNYHLVTPLKTLSREVDRAKQETFLPKEELRSGQRLHLQHLKLDKKWATKTNSMKTNQYKRSFAIW